MEAAVLSNHSHGLTLTNTNYILVFMVDIDNIFPCTLLSSTCKHFTEGKAVTGVADWPGTAKQIHSDITGLKSWGGGREPTGTCFWNISHHIGMW